jgi:hypothetical protein
MGIGQQIIIHAIDPIAPVTPENMMSVTKSAAIAM